MSKTAPIPDDIHELIINKQTEMRKKHKISVKISDLIAACVVDSIKRAERFFGVNTVQNNNVQMVDKKESKCDDISGGNGLSLIENNKGELKSDGPNDNILKPSGIVMAESEEAHT